MDMQKVTGTSFLNCSMSMSIMHGHRGLLSGANRIGENVAIQTHRCLRRGWVYGTETERRSANLELQKMCGGGGGEEEARTAAAENRSGHNRSTVHHEQPIVQPVRYFLCGHSLCSFLDTFIFCQSPPNHQQTSPTDYLAVIPPAIYPHTPRKVQSPHL